MKKKWAYCLIYASANEDSVQRKIKQQIEGLNSAGVKATGHFFTFDNLVLTTNPSTSEHIKFEHIGNYPNGWFQALKAKKACYKNFNNWLEKHAADYDVIYVRYHLSSYSFYKLCRKFGHKLGIEFQTKNIDEIRSFYKNNPFGLRPSKLLSWIENQLVPIFNEKFWGRLVLGKVKFIVGVTNEIAEYEQQRACGKKPKKLVVSNGFDVESSALREIPNYDGSELKLLMLVGSIKGSDWNGIDYIVEGIKKYTGNTKITFYLGGEMESNPYPDCDFFVPLGYLKGAEMENYLNDCHLALGAFALSRKNIKEASTLKFREYISKGVPVVYGYEDSDGDALCEQGLALRLPSDCELDMFKVVAFANQIYLNPNHAAEIRKFAKEHIDFTIKMKQLIKAVEQEN